MNAHSACAAEKQFLIPKIYSQSKNHHRRSIQKPSMQIGVIIVLFSISFASIESTNLGGVISTDTTLCLANSPYIVKDNIIVQPAVTLTIEPGVELRFDGNYYLEIEGALIAKGLSSKPIKFTSNKSFPQTGDWGMRESTNLNGINFTNSSLDATFDSNGNYISGSIIQYSIIEYGTGISLNASAPFVDNNTIRWSRDNGGAAIFFNGYNFIVTPQVRITNNWINTNQNLGLNIQQGSIIFENNLLEHNKGMFIADISGSIQRNTISCNFREICSPGAGTICIAFTNSATIQYNNIISNWLVDVALRFDATDIDFSNNYWGTPDENAIASRIYDNKDYSIIPGTVNFLPILTSPVFLQHLDLMICPLPGNAVYALTTSSGSGGTTWPKPGTYTYYEGARVTINAEPYFPYKFATWIGDVPSGQENLDPVAINMDGNKSITAHFTLPEYQPYISSISPDSGSEGTEVMISGLNFGSTQGTITFYDRVYASITSWSDTKIITIVPYGATTGPVEVRTAAKYNSNRLNFTVTTAPPVNKPPVSNAGEDRSVLSGELVYFDGRLSYDPDGTIASYRWDFGDGTTSEGQVANHRFRGIANISKTYTVTLTVEDDKRSTDTDITNIKVSPLTKTVEVIHQPPVPIFGPAISRMTATYNWIRDGYYVVSKIHCSCDEFLGISTISIWDLHSKPVPTLKWSANVFSFEKEKIFDPKIEKILYGGDTFEGIGVDAFDAMNIITIGWAGMSFSTSPSIPPPFFETNSICFQPEYSVVPNLPAEAPNWDLLNLCSSGELRVYDSLGRVTGLARGIEKEEIPNSGYYENTIIIISPSDSYKYEIMGTEEGAYGYRCTRVPSVKNEEINATTFVATDIPISRGSLHEYSIDWDALSQGKNGAQVKIDQTGDGVFEVVFNVGSTFSLLNASIDLDPDTLNLDSKGNPITCYIELPKGNDLKNISLNSVVLKKGEDLIATATGPNGIGDYDKDNIPDLMVKFDRPTVINYLKNHNITKGSVTFTVIGQIGNKIFAGTDIIKVIR